MADLVHPRERVAARRAPKMRGHRVEYLAFLLGGDVYAVPIGEVREILKLPPVTEVPRSPHEVMGVVSVRGLLVTVIDLRRKLRLSSVDGSRKGRILLVEGGEREIIGLYVDEVLQVYRLTEAEVEPANTVLGSQMADYVVGIGRPERGLLILIDLGPILGRAPEEDDPDAV
jgi:purine-binding chemotaxis protein CheW